MLDVIVLCYSSLVIAVGLIALFIDSTYHEFVIFL